ncbi:MAG TPA: TetR/AcrR family transcriptional regulator [Nitrospira sp.]|nr:TetR/AcrR family transcriptional regulator [Nitrospira sp.]
MPKKASISRVKRAAESPARNVFPQRIVSESRRHFFANGFRNVTMDDLAHELAMSKKTLYACFPSKTSLVEAAIVDKFKNVDFDLSRITSTSSSDCLAALRLLLECVQGHMEEIRPPFLRDIRRETPELFAVVEGRRRDLIQRHFGKVFQEGRRAGLIRHDIPSKLAIEILLGAVQAVMNPPKLEELGLTPKSGFTSIMRVVLEGLTTEKARSHRPG